MSLTERIEALRNCAACTPCGPFFEAIISEALAIIDTLVKRAEDAEAAVMKCFIYTAGTRRCIQCLSVTNDDSISAEDHPHKPDCIVAAIAKARGKP